MFPWLGEQFIKIYKTYQREQYYLIYNVCDNKFYYKFIYNKCSKIAMSHKTTKHIWQNFKKTIKCIYLFKSN